MPKPTPNFPHPATQRTARSKTRVPNAGNLVPIFSEKGPDRRQLISLHTLLTNKKNPTTRDAARLGDVLLPWFEKAIAKPAAHLEGIAELWQKHVPTNILRRCRLTGFHRGILSVALDSSTVRAELDAKLRADLLRTLQTESKGTLFRVKTSVDGRVSAN